MHDTPFAPLRHLRKWWSRPVHGRAPAAVDLHGPDSLWRSQPFRLIIAASAVSIAVIIAAACMLLANLRSEQIAKSNRDLASLASLLSQQIDRSFQSIELVQAGVLDRIKALGIKSPEDLSLLMSGYDAHQRFKDQISALPYIDAIVLTGPDGRLINFSRSWPAPPIQNPESNRVKIFEMTGLNSFVGRPLRSPTMGDWVLPIVRKVSGPDGRLIGILVGTMRLRYFEQLFKSIARNHDRSIALFTGDGTLVARYPHNESLRGRSFARRAIFRDILSKGRSGTVQQAGIVGGKELLISGHNLAAYPMAVVVTKTVDDVLAGWWDAVTYVAGAAIIIVLMIGGAGFLVARQIADKLKAQNRRLDAALNNMSQALTMFDASGRLIVCNERYVKMFNMSADLVKPGRTLAELLQYRIDNGTYETTTFGDVDRHADRLIEQIAGGKPVPLVCELNDGRIISISNQPMPGGGWVATHEDITEARRREASFELLFDSNPIPMLVYDLETLNIIAVNDAAVAHYGYSREAFMAMSAFDIRPPEERARFAKFVEGFSGRHEAEQPWRHRKADGTTFDVDIYARALDYRGRRASIIAVHDITDRKRAEEKLRRTQKFLDTIVENVPVPIFVKEVPASANDAKECPFTLINRASEELLGIDRGHIIGKTLTDIYPPEQAEFVAQENNVALRAKQPVVLSDHKLYTPGNGLRIAAARSVAVRDDDDKPQYLLTVLEDVTERKRAEERIARMAHYDNLTDLPNRTSFNEAIKAMLERAEKSGEQFAVLSLDLDGFKDANDTYGHAVGDALLREVAHRLQTAAEGALLARIGGDEFMLIVAGDPQPEAATTLAERLLLTLAGDFDIEERRVTVGATIGGAIFPLDGTDAKTLMINADIALYRAKAEVRGTVLFFDAEMGEQVRERRALQADLRAATEKDELFLHYQPQLTISGSTIGFEALLRWNCPRRGIVPPAAFVPLAEENGLIVQIDEWVLRAACREAASWPEPLTVAVNISPTQFRTGDFPGFVHAVLLESGLPASRLELEVTEGVLIDDFSRAISILCRLKALGVRIALDDFGTGYSSMSYLHSFPFDKIKIDRAFVGDLGDNRHSMAIVRAVIDLGHSLNVPILAEGVETAEQHAILLRAGCDEVQGYLTGRPKPIADYAAQVGRGTCAGTPAVLAS